jgi:predicted lipopolysaccharide heptosyltransferase III
VNILLVRLRLIGDVVFTTPLIHALRQKFPDARLTYVVEELAAPVVRGNPHIDDLIVVPRRAGLARLRDDWRLARRLRRTRFDVAIDLHGGPRAAWLARASGAPMRIGYTIKGRSWMYTHRIPRSADLRPRHSVENQFDVLAPLGIDGGDPLHHPLEMPEDASARHRVDERLRTAGITAAHDIVLVHVSAGNVFRRWPADSFASLAAGLVRRDACRRIILISGPSDRSAASAIAERARIAAGPAGHAIAAGEYDLSELRALAARAAVYIGTDSGPLHVAATTGAPIVELLGPKLAEHSRPWREPGRFCEVVEVGPLPCRPCQERVCEPGDFRCLTGISVERVIAAAERAMRHGTYGPGCDFPADGTRESEPVPSTVDVK